MDWYTLFKLLHVIAAIIWIGGAFLVLMLGLKAVTARNDAELVGVIRQVGWAAERIFVPASIATLLLGAVAATLAGLWSALWVGIALIGIAISMALGMLALTPRAKRVAAAGGVTPESAAIARQMVTLIKFDCAALLVVVADMVLKPQIGDWAIVALMAVVVLAAAAAWLVPVIRRPAAAA